MRADWIESKYVPKEPGPYLVTTAKGAVIIDRWDGSTWGLCTPRARTGSCYRMHKAWSMLPRAYKED